MFRTARRHPKRSRSAPELIVERRGFGPRCAWVRRDAAQVSRREPGIVLLGRAIVIVAHELRQLSHRRAALCRPDRARVPEGAAQLIS